MARTIRRLIACSMGLICLPAAGCLQIPFYVPEFNSVPAVNPGCDGKDDLHAFRVDVTQTMELKEGRGPNYTVRGENFENFELTRIETAPGGTTSTQRGVSAATGWCYVGFWNYCSSYTSHSIAVRLYRRGYETIELKPGQPASALQWQEATSLAAQEKAVDDLLGVSPLERIDAKSSQQQRRLESGTKSAAHREALLFAAREYERLAGRTDLDDPIVGARLIDKANRLKALAKGR
jgi:hypothetical protein